MKHLMIDIYGIDQSLLESRSVLLATLNELPEIIGMQKAAEPSLEEIKTSNALDDGMSGFVIICTSHVSLHAWPPYGMLNLDVFSCNDFETEVVKEYLREHFEIQRADMEMNEIERATRSPREAMLHPV